VYNQTLKFQSLKSLRITTMFLPNCAPNGLHGFRAPVDRIPYSINISLCPSTHRPTRISIPQTFWIKILHSPILSELLNLVKKFAFWWSMTTLTLFPKTCLHYFVWIVSEIGLHTKCFLFGWPRYCGKTIVAIFHALSPLLQPDKETRNNKN